MTINPENRLKFEKIFQGKACACIGSVTRAPDLVIKGLDQKIIFSKAVPALKEAWKQPFKNQEFF